MTLRRYSFYFSLLLLVLLSSTVFAQHLVYITNTALGGTGSPTYGYSGLFSMYTVPSGTSAGTYLYVANGGTATIGGLNIFNVAIPDGPALSGNVYQGNTYYQQIVTESRSYMATSNAGIRTYTLATTGNNAQRPVNVSGNAGQWATDAQNMAKVGNYIYIAAMSQGMKTANVTTLANPTQANIYNDGTTWTSIDANANVVAAAHDGGIQLFTKVDPSSPQVSGSIGVGGSAYQIHLDGNNLYYMVIGAVADSGVWKYDVSNPASPQLLGRIHRTVTSYLIDTNYVYLANNIGSNSSRIYTYDWSNVASPVIIDSLDASNAGQITNMYRWNGYLYGYRTNGANHDFINMDILGSIHLITDNGGDTLYTGDTVNITWSGFRFPGVVRIEVNRNYPSGAWEYVGDATFTDGQFAWPVTGPTTTNARFRVRNTTYSILSDEGDASLSILTRAVTYTGPAAASIRYIGDNDTISWNTLGVTGNVRIDFSNNFPAGGWQTLGTAPATAGSYVWTIAATPSTTARYRVTSLVYPALSDSTSGDITIAARTIAVTYPNGGETWYQQDTVNIAWTPTNVDGNVVVELNRTYPSGSFGLLGITTATAGTFSYPVVGPNTTGATARIRIRSMSYPVANDTSNANFTISSRALALTKPVGGETFYVLNNDTIKWTFANLPGTLRIELNRSYPNGTWELIATPNVSASRYIWNYSAPVTTTARIRITSVNYPWFNATSPANFTIQANPGPYHAPINMSFTNIPIGTTSAAQTTATASRSQLFIKATSWSHSNSRFHITMLNADSSATGTDTIRFSITFTPDTISTQYDTLRVGYNAPYTSTWFYLTGSGTGSYFRLPTTNVVFDTTEAGESRFLSFTLQNTGNVALVPVRASGNNNEFSFSLPGDSTVPANGIASATLSFTPQGAGLRSSTLQFTAPNGIGTNTYTVNVSGLGKTTPASPTGVAVTTNANNATIQWNPVTQSIHGYDVSVDRYLVFFNASSPYNANNFYYLTYTLTDTFATHPGVVLFSPSMNYQVRSWVGNSSTFDRVIRTIPKGTPMNEVWSRLQPFQNRN